MKHAERETPGPGFHGDFTSWDEAATQCVPTRKTASEQRESMARTVELFQRALRGDLAFVRDGVPFVEPENPWPVLAYLLRAAAERHGALRVIDFGGSLGTTFLQARTLLATLPEVRWAVVERPEIAAAGRQALTSEQLSFFDSFAEARDAGDPDVVLFSGVLPYLPEPYAILDEVLRSSSRYILLDRTVVVAGDRSRVAIQTVPSFRGEISWPARLFCRRDLLQAFQPDFRAIAEFASYCDPVEEIDGLRIDYKGFAFERVRA